jgi:hypothetical protein
MANPDLIITLAIIALITGVALLVNWAANRLIPGLLANASKSGFRTPSCLRAFR